ncbi:MAG TPA: hypothetical protein VIH90_03370 [Candidatus Saccharimonadales bacterium]
MADLINSCSDGVVTSDGVNVIATMATVIGVVYTVSATALSRKILRIVIAEQDSDLTPHQNSIQSGEVWSTFPVVHVLKPMASLLAQVRARP